MFIADGNSSKENAVVDDDASVGFTGGDGKRKVGTSLVNGVSVGAIVGVLLLRWKQKLLPD